MSTQREYKVYQIRAHHDEAPEERTRRRDAAMGWNFLKNHAGYADVLPDYRHVANVTAEDAEHAFRLMNLWEVPERVRVVENEQPHSLSVGDVLVDPEGRYLFCDNFGFKDITEDHQKAVQGDDLDFQKGDVGASPAP